MKWDPSGKDRIPGYSVIARDLPKEDAVCESLTSRSTLATLSFIKKNKDHPFFVYVPFNMPHLGVYANDAFKGKSRRGLLGDAMEEIDHSVGQIRKTIEELGLTKNTLIIFPPIMDHGSAFRIPRIIPIMGRHAFISWLCHPFSRWQRIELGGWPMVYRESLLAWHCRIQSHQSITCQHPLMCCPPSLLSLGWKHPRIEPLTVGISAPC